MDTYGEWTHSSLGLNYLKQFALSHSGISNKINFLIQSVPEKEIRTPYNFTRFDWYQEAVNYSPDVIGLSCYLWNRVGFCELARRLKRVFPSSIIILGGPEFNSTIITRKVLESCEVISFIISGEGEYPFALVLEQLIAENPSFSSIPGLSYWLDRECLVKPAFLGVRNLNIIPTPFTKETLKKKYDYILYETYRGCLQNCSYCSWSKTACREFTIERVLKDLIEIIETGHEKVYFIDPVFGPNLERAKAILDFIEKKGNERGQLPGFYIFPDTTWYDHAFAEQSRRLNCTIGFGMPHFKPTYEDSIQEEHLTEPIIKCFQTARETIPNFSTDIIFGLPDISTQRFYKQFDTLARLSIPDIHCHQLHILPGSGLELDAEQLNLNYFHDPPYLIRSTNALSLHEVHDLERFSRGVSQWYSIAPLSFHYYYHLIKESPSSIIREFLQWSDDHEFNHSGKTADPFTQTYTHKINCLKNFLSDNDRPIIKEHILIFKSALEFDLQCCVSFRNNPMTGIKRYYNGATYEDLASHQWQIHKGFTNIVNIPNILSMVVENLYNFSTNSAIPFFRGKMNHPYLVYPFGFLRINEQIETLITFFLSDTTITIDDLIQHHFNKEDRFALQSYFSLLVKENILHKASKLS